MTAAFVLSGGASLGAVQVGMAIALSERGIVPELVVGTSVGAINGAWLAGGRDPADLVDVWTSLDRDQVFETNAWQGVRALAGRSNHFISNAGLRGVLEQHLPFERIEDADVPLIVVATDALSGAEVLIDRGPAVDAILASSSLPAVFEPVEIEGRLLVDGAVVNNTPITTAIEAGATEVWVLSAGYAHGLTKAPTGAIAAALHAVSLMVQRRFVLELAARHYEVPVHLLPPPSAQVSPVDMSRSAELIERAATDTRAWLDGPRPETDLG